MNDTHSIIQNLQNNMNKVIIGKDDKITLLLTALLAKGHLLYHNGRIGRDKERGEHRTGNHKNSS